MPYFYVRNCIQRQSFCKGQSLPSSGFVIFYKQLCFVDPCHKKLLYKCLKQNEELYSFLQCFQDLSVLLKENISIYSLQSTLKNGFCQFNRICKNILCNEPLSILNFVVLYPPPYQFKISLSIHYPDTCYFTLFCTSFQNSVLHTTICYSATK